MPRELADVQVVSRMPVPSSHLYSSSRSSHLYSSTSSLRSTSLDRRSATLRESSSSSSTSGSSYISRLPPRPSFEHRSKVVSDLPRLSSRVVLDVSSGSRRSLTRQRSGGRHLGRRLSRAHPLPGPGHRLALIACKLARAATAGRELQPRLDPDAPLGLEPQRVQWKQWWKPLAAAATGQSRQGLRGLHLAGLVATLAEPGLVHQFRGLGRFLVVRLLARTEARPQAVPHLGDPGIANWHITDIPSPFISFTVEASVPPTVKRSLKEYARLRR
ncbi:hypothetical protein MTO96_008536 [Rhipicephalus appendiculatus]